MKRSYAPSMIRNGGSSDLKVDSSDRMVPKASSNGKFSFAPRVNGNSGGGGGGILKRPSVDRLPNGGISDRGRSNEGREDEGDVKTITRQPLFEFLEIPNNLKREFRVPSGCKITKKSIELRKVKHLGTGYNKTPFLKPGDLKGFAPVTGLVKMDYAEEGEEDDEGDEDLPKETIPPFERLILWKDPNFVAKVKTASMDRDESQHTEGEEEEDLLVQKGQHSIEVIPMLASKLRPHQREGVQFLFECTMGLRGFEGEGCILADDMGLGKTLMSITLLWTLMNQGFSADVSAVRKVVVACPTSLVGNWDNEIKKWVGEKCNTFPVKSDPKAIIRNFVSYRGKGVLIVSYETQRRYSKMFPNPALDGKKSSMMSNNQSCCDLLICDEAHKLKNADSGLAQSLMQLPAKKRILLSGTPMQNELLEFFNMVNFCNPGVLGTSMAFRKKYERPILESREPDCSESKRQKAMLLQKELSTIVNEFILKRGNILNAKHLPPKLVQFVCCKLTDEQQRMYDALLGNKDMRHLMEGKQMETLAYIRHLINICSHPRLLLDSYNEKLKRGETDDVLQAACATVTDLSLTALLKTNEAPASKDVSMRSNRSGYAPKGNEADGKVVDPSLSGKLFVLYRLMLTMRALKNGERIVVVSNYTSTLDLVDTMCSQNKWPVLRLDGTTAGPKRTKLVAQFNDPYSGAFAFLLSSKAGGCGINLIGGNRLVLFDPDWNPASDKQAAGRIWREGQKRRCFIYRFMSSGTIEEKIIQRQLSKEGLQNIVENTDQVNEISTKELKSLFVRRGDTPSDTHDTLKCKRCSTVRAKDISAAGDKHLLNEAQRDICVKFVADLMDILVREAASIEKVFNTEDLQPLIDNLKTKKIKLLTDFSKQLQRTCAAIQRDHDQVPAEEKIFPNYVHIEQICVERWMLCVPQLRELGKSKQKEDVENSNSDDCGEKERSGGDEDDEKEEELEFVDQEGCPDETDFNKWSHHISTNTIDDDVMAKAMADDDTVSFVFGLEVNWDLLQEKELLEADEKEARKEQQRLDLLELNTKRGEERKRMEELNHRRKEKEEREKQAMSDTANTISATGGDDPSEIDMVLGSGACAKENVKKEKREKKEKSGSKKRTSRPENESSSGSEVSTEKGFKKPPPVRSKHLVVVDDDDDDDFKDFENMNSKPLAKEVTETTNVEMVELVKADRKKKRHSSSSSNSQHLPALSCDVMNPTKEMEQGSDSDDSEGCGRSNSNRAGIGNRGKGDDFVLLDSPMMQSSHHDTSDETSKKKGKKYKTGERGKKFNRDADYSKQSDCMAIDKENEPAVNKRKRDLPWTDASEDQCVSNKEAVTEKQFAASSVEENASDKIVEANEVVEEEGWTCVTCEFQNTEDDDVCCACERRRPSARRSSGSSQGRSQGDSLLYVK